MSTIPESYYADIEGLTLIAEVTITNPLWRFAVHDPNEKRDPGPGEIAVPNNEESAKKQAVLRAADILRKSPDEIKPDWKRSGAIVQDPIPGIYVYYQYFTFPGSTSPTCRKGFISHIRVHDWNEGKILRHENTMPVSVNDRLEILDKTQMHVSPTHGLYVDDDLELEAFMDESILNPIYETEDYQGVRDVLSVIHDHKVISRFQERIKDQSIILADGHHRYAGSLDYMKKQKGLNTQHTGNEGYNFHLMYLTNARTDTVRILPTHRLIKGIEKFDEDQLLTRLEKYFTIKPVINPNEISEIILGKQWAFGLLLKDRTFKIRLKPEVFSQLTWNFPEEVKKLDLTVLHYFVIDKIIGIPGHKHVKSNQIFFERNFTNCHDKVLSGEVQLALITKEISMEEVLNVCQSGYTMPQKSTFFYPKVVCGFLFSSIQDDEFVPFPDIGI